MQIADRQAVGLPFLGSESFRLREFVDDPSLYRAEAVRDVRQRLVEFRLRFLFPSSCTGL